MTSNIKISRTALEGVERVMRRCQWIAVIGLALIGSECGAVVMITPHDAVNLQHHDGAVHAAPPMQVGAWHDTPARGQFAMISGDPAKPTPFVMRVKLPPGYTLSPCRWRNEEHIVVVACTLQVSAGSAFDENAMHELPSGSFISLAANESRFAMTRRGAVLQIFGIGPFAIEGSSFDTPGVQA
jgi:hypothetical protein